MKYVILATTALLSPIALAQPSMTLVCNQLGYGGGSYLLIKPSTAGITKAIISTEVSFLGHTRFSGEVETDITVTEAGKVLTYKNDAQSTEIRLQILDMQKDVNGPTRLQAKISGRFSDISTPAKDVSTLNAAIYSCRTL